MGPTVCELDGPMPMENRSKTDTAMANPYSKLGFRSNVDAGWERRRLGLHRAAHDGERHCSPGQHHPGHSGEHQRPTPALGLARVGDDLRQVRKNLLCRSEFLRDGVLRVAELLGEPAFVEAATDAADRRVGALQA